jgi:putative ABC transport system permease protein
VVKLAALDLKLARDLWRLRGHLLAVALVAACGTASWITMRGSYEALLAAQAAFYEQERFADLFASAKRAPASLVARVRDIPGVASAEDRVVFDVTLDVPGLREPATGRLVSIPEHDRATLNDVRVRSGRYIEPGARGEVLASAAFAEANGLKPGDTLAAVINGRWQRLRVVGIAVSPEYVHAMAGVFPDDRRFGILWIGREALEAALDMKGAFNDLSVRLAPGASARAVIDRIDQLLAPYGGLGAYDRDQQPSHQFLRDEIEQDRVTGTVVPAIFALVAAFLVHNVLVRLIALQRAQIGLLKAFGYGRAAIAWHYAKLALTAVLAGCAAGIPLGLWLGHGLADLYREFFNFPALEFVLSGTNLLGVALFAAATALAGALPAVRRALALPPAESMRPPAPPTFRPLLAERLGLQAWLPPAVRMVLRDLERRPLRAVLSILAVALGTALLVVGQYSSDAIDEIVRVVFRNMLREDVMVKLNEARELQVRNDLAALPGVLRVEPFRQIPVRLGHEHRERRVMIEALPPDGQLRRVLDRRLNPVAIPPDGLIVSAALADLLGARPGDVLTVEVLEGARQVRRVPMVATVDEMFGLWAYMDLAAAARLLGETASANGARLAVDPRALDSLYAQLKQMPAVAGVALREVSLEGFLDTIAKNMLITTVIMVAFACVIAAGVVYNGARIALSEHAVELASLRILGFTRGEVGAMLLAEQAIVTAVAIPLGCLIGYGLAAAVVAAFSGEVYRIPLVISPRTYLVSAAVVVAAAALSGALVLYHLRRIDLVAVLKTRE